MQEDEQQQPERAPVLLALVRIISVLGMSFAVAFGLFMLLGFWWWQAAVSFLAAIPFFVVMRYVEKWAGEHGS
ncbi:MAG TPA: hypothetical protein VI759_09140 [Dehalococcoidia bacterium]|nr:hypothetical protein [Dehalococcoidia bacterium]